MKTWMKTLWNEWVKPLLLMAAIVTPLKSAVLDWNWVPTGSMKPTILEGDLVLVNKLAYDLKIPFTTKHLAEWGNPSRGEVAVFFSPKDGTRLVKRVVGLPGDTVELRNETLYVNGVRQTYAVRDVAPFKRDVFEDPNPILAKEKLGEHEHYVMVLPSRGALRSFGPLVVPEGHYFMMGDSRDNSFDSRFFGAVPRKEIVGRGSGIILSLDLKRWLLPRFSRFGTSLDGGAEKS